MSNSAIRGRRVVARFAPERRFSYSTNPLRTKGQLTVPDDIRKAARLEEGDLLEAEVKDEGDLLEAEVKDEGVLLQPQMLIDATQEWFWAPEWQRGEGSRRRRTARRLATLASGDELIAALRSRGERRPARSSR